MDCGHRDVFFFDSLRDAAPPGQFDLNDYPHGHRMKLGGNVVQGLAKELSEFRSEIIAARARSVDDFLGKNEEGEAQGHALRTLLDNLSFDARFERPDHLIRCVKTFICAADRGVLWLQMPAHTGKTMFTRAIGQSVSRSAVNGPNYMQRGSNISPYILQSISRSEDLGQGVGVAAVFITREYRYDGAGIASALWTELVKVLDIAPEDFSKCPHLDLNASNRPSAFVRFLQGLLNPRFKGRKAPQRLLIVLDGLDELRDPAGAAITEFIPRDTELPDGVYILLTSRNPDDADCPEWLMGFDRRLDGSAVIKKMTLSDVHYEKLLRRYIKNNVRGAGIALTDKEEAAIINAADRRFLYVSFYVDRIVAGELGREEISKLPEESKGDAERYHAYISTFERELGSRKIAEQATRILSALAAFASAHSWCFDEGDLGGAVRDPANSVRLISPVSHDFKGVPLEILARIVNGLVSSSEGLTIYRVDFLYVLAKLKPAIGIWRGASAAGTAHYRLWNQALIPAIKRAATADMKGIHSRIVQIAEEAAACFATEGSDVVKAENAAEAFVWPYVAAHLSLASIPPSSIGSVLTLQSKLSLGNYMDARSRQALQWADAKLFNQYHYDRLSGSALPTMDFAVAIQRRAQLRLELGDARGGLMDFDVSLQQIQQMRSMAIGGDYKPARRDLYWHARGYVGRGDSLEALGDSELAEKDLDAALGLLGRDEDRKVCGLASEQLDLATCESEAYMKRAQVHISMNNSSGALSDAQRAVSAAAAPEFRTSNLSPEHMLVCGRAFFIRAQAESAFGSRRRAIEDYTKYLELIEQVRTKKGSAFPPSWNYDIAVALHNRALEYKRLWRRTAAARDLDESLRLMDDLKKLAGELPHAWEYNVGSTYAHRAMVRFQLRDIHGGLSDSDLAIAILERLKEDLGPRCPFYWRQSLGLAYAVRAGLRPTMAFVERLADLDRGIGEFRELYNQEDKVLTPEFVSNYKLLRYRRASILSFCGEYGKSIADLRAAIDLHWRFLPKGLRVSHRLFGLLLEMKLGFVRAKERTGP